MPNNRKLWHLFVWVGITLMGVVAWWATGTAWEVVLAVIAGIAAFDLAKRQRRIGQAECS